MAKQDQHNVKVRVNEYMSVELRIPAEIDMETFSALFGMVDKVNQLKKDIPSAESSAGKDPETSTRKGEWSKNEEETLINTWDSSKNDATNFRAVASKLDRDHQQVMAKYYYWRNNHPSKYKEMTGQHPKK